MKYNDSDYSELIVRFLDGKATEQEKEMLMKWLDQNEDNETLLFELKRIHEGVLGTALPDCDMKSGWADIERRNRKNNLKTIIRHTLSYAAVFAIAALAGFFIFRGQHTEQPAIARHVGGNGISADMVELTDGTRIYIGSLTTFHCDENYGHKNRTVYLDGEAYFDVTKQNGKPFVVKAKGIDITVLGTRFNVSAYASDSVAVTTLVEGSVEVAVKSTNRRERLTPNQQYVFNHNTQLGSLSLVNAGSLVSWIDGYYVFREQPLVSIIHHLENMYSVTFDLKAEKYRNIQFSGTFYRGQSMKEILELLSIAIPVNYAIDGNRITINDKN